MPAPDDLGSVLGRAKVLVCVGAGGVGKTTVSAAVAMEAARQGRRVIVLTIDPARRLAAALGLPEIGNEERVVGGEAFEAMGLDAPSGVLSAMMLDVKTSWDEVIRKYHPEPEAKRRLLENRLYFTLSTALDNDATRWLLEPYTVAGRVTSRLFDAGSSFVIRTLGRLTGTATLEELAELLSQFQGMYEGFRQRAKAVRIILSDPSTSFWVVAAPHASPIETAISFYERLDKDGIAVGAFILNRAEPDPFASGEPSRQQLLGRVLALGGSAAMVERWHALAQSSHIEAEAESKRRNELAAQVAPDGVRPVRLVPELQGDIHDLQGLDALRQRLFDSPSPAGEPPVSALRES